jgi:hypothetical protein
LGIWAQKLYLGDVSELVETRKIDSSSESSGENKRRKEREGFIEIEMILRSAEMLFF